MMGSGEVIYEKVYASLRPLPKISLKHEWMKELGSEVDGGREDSQQIQPKSETQFSRTWRLVSEQPSGLLRRSKKMSCLAAKAQTQERGDL